MQSKVLIIQNALTQLEGQIHTSSLSADVKNRALTSVRAVDVELILNLYECASAPLTKANLLYIVCFLAGIDTQVIASIFHVELATVYTVRYRLRSCFNTISVSPF
ncbi:MAG: hypothetical protein J6J71_05360 [Prevotella sp.]|nr:hypothetical protein [Prevotella sp.]